MRSVIGLLVVAGSTGLAAAGPVETGRGLVEANCAVCHAIGPSGTSPHSAAPPFRDVVKRYDPSALEEAFAEGILVGHPDMPAFELKPEQIEAVIAYLGSLKTP
ncbi:MAG: c-type cytochrome [Labrys sp. (in: a-proteobacteria)]